MNRNEIISWLLASDPWVEYRTRLDLLNESISSPDVQLARNRMIDHPLVKNVIEELTNWPGIVLNSHKSASQYFHKLSFLADIGVKHDDPKIGLIVDKIFEHTSTDGPFQLPMNIPTHFGGTGLDQWAWVLCDAPITVYSLAKMGLANDERVIKAKNYLVNLGRNNGYPCFASPELGKFRGPGKKEDPCPYATLIMLKLLSLYEEDKNSDFAKNSVETLLNLWENSRTLRPYIFYMGTDFRKLKAPFIWYDILHVADTLSNFPQFRRDKRFIEMVDIVSQKVDEYGLFTPESVWQAWKGWDFAQKKKPSAWLSFLVYRLRMRVGESNKK
jgi:hypothetical protein